MTTDQVQAIGPEFTAFLRPFERFFAEPETVRHFRNYSRGLLTDLPRKTAEPLAMYVGTPPRCLQQFLKACLWDHDGLTDGKAAGEARSQGPPGVPRMVKALLRYSTGPSAESASAE